MILLQLTRRSRRSPRWSLSPLLALAVACGGASNTGDEEPARPSASPPPSPTPSPSQTAPAPAPTAPQGISPAAIAAASQAAGMVAEQVRAACGSTFDRCNETPGCSDILTCAARNTCAGSACYCADERCTSPGPCRTTIDGAPGARSADSANPSLGPASDAATAVGRCLQGLAPGSGTPTRPPATTPTTPVEPPDAGVDADAG
jgi:hypothetical protein